MKAPASEMLAARLYGPGDLRVERIPRPGIPGEGQVLLRVRATGICGSDLHSYQDARIGDTKVESPLILGHEFSAVVEAAGPRSMDGRFEPLGVGQRVAVDPAQPCGRCEMCERDIPIYVGGCISAARTRTAGVCVNGCRCRRAPVFRCRTR